MNKQNIIKLRDFLRDLPESKFKWESFLSIRPSCGTAACIAGWAPFVFEDLVDPGLEQAEGESFEAWRKRTSCATSELEHTHIASIGETSYTQYLSRVLGLPIETASWLIYAETCTGRKDLAGEPLYVDGINAPNGRDIAIRRLSALANGCVQ